jgi:hypothetical protein
MKFNNGKFYEKLSRHFNLHLKLKLSHCTQRGRLGGGEEHSSYSLSTLALDGMNGQQYAMAML